MTIVEFLRARYEDEGNEARAAIEDGADIWQAAPLNSYRPAAWVRAVSDEESWRIADVNTIEQARHIARHDPARVLREVEAKRRLVDRHAIKLEETGVRRGAPICAECGGSDWKPDVTNGVHHLSPYPWVMPWPCPTLRLLALPFADHPDYDPTWSPA